MAEVPQPRTALPAGIDRRYLVGFDTDELSSHTADVIVVGSGIAGLTAALEIAPTRSVLLVTKGRMRETATWYAQGGIAGAVGEADSVELHLADTLVVGQGLCDERVVRAVVEEAPEALEHLQSFGVEFDLAEGGGVALAREGGHSLPRVLHSGDATGATIQEALAKAVVRHERITILEERFLVDFLTHDGACIGALLLDAETGVLEVARAGATILATGGCGQAYRVTTNPAIATGDGVAAAWRAGATISDVEFVQFHPTALDSGANPRFLLTEALRGEGAYLVDCDRERFMLGVHPLAELAPRDVVSREIERVMAMCGLPNVWLDARHLGEEYLRTRFPTIWDACREAGLDLSKDFIPVAPAAHYLMGGVSVDLEGRTTVPGLFASGEVTCSGLHGANRLASNSLLEGLVFSLRIARTLAEHGVPPVSEARIASVPAHPALSDSDAGPDFAALRTGVQTTMSTHVAMARSAASLATARTALDRLGDSCRALPLDASALEAANLITVASLITNAAAVREETRGAHSRVDFPLRDDEHWSMHVACHREMAAGE